MKIFYGRRDQECNDGIGCSGTFPVSGSLGLYHQNICGLRRKVNHDVPHLICISEHHLNNVEMDYIHLPNYKLGAKYSRKSSLKGGVFIFIHNIKFQVIKLDLFCRDKDIEVCAVKLQLTNINTCVLMVYRAPSGNLDYFLNKLDIILKTLLHPNFEYIICRLTSSRSKRKLPNAWACLALSFTGEVVCPSGTEYFCISSSYGP